MPDYRKCNPGSVALYGSATPHIFVEFTKNTNTPATADITYWITDSSNTEEDRYSSSNSSQNANTLFGTPLQFDSNLSVKPVTSGYYRGEVTISGIDVHGNKVSWVSTPDNNPNDSDVLWVAPMYKVRK